MYVRAFAASGSAGGERWLISNSGGLSPAWSPNGRELLYRAGDQIMTVGYTVERRLVRCGETASMGRERARRRRVRSRS